MWLTQLGIKDVVYIPISALNGDNIVDRSEQIDWYDGKPLTRMPGRSGN